MAIPEPPKCPVCGKPLKEDYNDRMEGTVMEYRYSCDGHFIEEFAYGHLSIYIPKPVDEEFFRSHDGEPADWKKFEEGVAAAAKRQKEALGL